MKWAEQAPGALSLDTQLEYRVVFVSIALGPCPAGGAELRRLQNDMRHAVAGDGVTQRATAHPIRLFPIEGPGQEQAIVPFDHLLRPIGNRFEINQRRRAGRNTEVLELRRDELDFPFLLGPIHKLEYRLSRRRSHLLQIDPELEHAGNDEE